MLPAQLLVFFFLNDGCTNKKKLYSIREVYCNKKETRIETDIKSFPNPNQKKKKIDTYTKLQNRQIQN